jgi:16S rRNA processing protein RimM
MQKAPFREMVPMAKILKSFGTEGEVIAKAFSSFPEEINLDQPVFITFDGIPVPFFIDKIKPHGTSRYLIKFKGVDDPGYSQELCSLDILRYMSEEPAPHPSMEHFTGYSIIENGVRSGTITGFKEFPGNPCFEALLEESRNTILIPAHEDIITEISDEKREIHVNLPEGLKEL